MRRFLLTFFLFHVVSLQYVRARADDDVEVIPGQYIVYYEEDADQSTTNERLFFSSTSTVASSTSFRVVRELNKAIAVAGINEDQYQALKEDPSVKKVIPDFILTIDTVQSNPPNWGLDRIDQATLPLDNAYEFEYEGTGVRVFIMDTGIRSTHVQFQLQLKTRVTCGANFVAGEGCEDNNGHGTHVAGIVGGSAVGVAKGVSLITVKVFGADGSAPFSTMIAGLEYVVEQKRDNPNTPMVVNMSLGGRGRIAEFREIVDEAVALGIVVVVAAGNDGNNACQTTPAFIASAITVAASDQFDKSASFSNHGSCVDIYAPGVDITSAVASSDVSGATLSGTSMAAPHVAGAAALYLEAHPEWTPDQVWNAMRDDATDVISFPQKLLPFRFIARFFRSRRTTTGLLLQTQNI